MIIPSTISVSAEAPCYRHVRRGTTYRVIGTATLHQASSIPKDGWPMVIYIDEHGNLHVRASLEFFDGRFERIVP